MTDLDLQLRAAPGYIVGVPRERPTRTPGGIILPQRAELPIVTVLHDGGHPHGACESCAEARSSKAKGFWIEEGFEVVVAGPEYLMRFGEEDLVLVAYSAIVARVLRVPKGV